MYSSSKAAATAGHERERVTATGCAGVSPHQRDQRFLSSKDGDKLHLFRAGLKIIYFCRIYLQALMTFIQQSIFVCKCRQNASISNPLHYASQILLR